MARPLVVKEIEFHVNNFNVNFYIKILIVCTESQRTAMGCRNGGTCRILVARLGIYWCVCPRAYEGPRCERPRSGNVGFKGAVSRSYHDFERFKNIPSSYITQQKWFYFEKHHSTNDNNPLRSKDG